MSAGYYRYDLTIELQAPFVIAGTQRRGFGVDLAQIRNHEDQPIIPDTHFRGVLRHAWQVLAAPDGLDARSLFGEPGTDEAADGGDDPSGRIWFRDLVAGGDLAKSQIVRASIDDLTGTSQDGHLINIEQLAAPRGRVAFSGDCVVFCRNADEASAIAGLLRKALGAVSSLGRFKTVGYGRIVGFDVSNPQLEAPDLAPPVASSETRFELTCTLDRPFLVDISRPDSNTLVGKVVVPGAVLKGALAKKFHLAGRDTSQGALADVLSKMRIGHATPKRNGVGYSSRARDLIAKRDQMPARMGDVGAMNFEKEQDAYSFYHDWKGGSFSFTPEGPSIPYETRTHVGIDSAKGAAIDGALFSNKAVVPSKGRETTTWVASVIWPDKPEGAEYDLFLHCLGQFKDGLFTVGKTNARLSAEVKSVSAASAISSTAFFRVEVKTPANILMAEHMSDEAALVRALDEYWDEVSDGYLSLAWESEDNAFQVDQPSGAPDTDKAVFCTHSYRNDFFVRRYRKGEPFVVTAPGSVFILASNEPEQAAGVLKRLVDHGLPVPIWEEGGPDTARIVRFSCKPFIPENGYGAISVEEMGT